MHETPKNNSPSLPGPDLETVLALRFVARHWFLILPISAVVLIPIFWHRRIEAGDLASHTYNAWLATLIERGQAPGLYIVPQWTNLIVDVALARLGSAFGFPAAEKVVIPACVLVFFWGAFALIGAYSRQAPWFLTPAIAMIAYGWTFQMGFMNYYLSLGFVFFAWALIWRGRASDWVVASILGGCALLAHPMGFAILVAAVAYVKLAEKLRGWARCGFFASAFLVLLALHFYIVHHFRTQVWDTALFFTMNGTDQLILYGRGYAHVARAALIFGSAFFIYADFREGRGTPRRWWFRTMLELWAILVFVAAVIPELIQVPIYAGSVGFLVSRLTSVTAVVGLCMLGPIKPRWCHLAGFSIMALFFFALLYRDTGSLNHLEAQAEKLLSTLPPGRRIAEQVATPPDSRIYFVHHLVDRACIGRCFSYFNYEAPSGQFRIRVHPGSPVASDTLNAQGYTVRAEDLPLTLAYQCQPADPLQLCIRDLAAGEKLGPPQARSH